MVEAFFCTKKKIGRKILNSNYRKKCAETMKVSNKIGKVLKFVSNSGQFQVIRNYVERSDKAERGKNNKDFQSEFPSVYF